MNYCDSKINVEHSINKNIKTVLVTATANDYQQLEMCMMTGLRQYDTLSFERA